MQFAVSIEKEYSLIRLTGRLDATQAPGLSTVIRKSLQEGPPNLILDCSGLSYVASMGLRCFLLAQKETRECAGRLVLFGLNDNVRAIFSMTRLDQIVYVTANFEDALTCLG